MPPSAIVPQQPRDEADLIDMIRNANAIASPLELIGAGSQRGLGTPTTATQQLHLSALSGIKTYEPGELVLTANAATPLAEIEAILLAHQQQLAFEPPDLAALWNAETTRTTLGGIMATNASGPRRIYSGGARDHFLGVKAVGGNGVLFHAGGKVVKNVTGYDLCKLLAASWGTLAAISEISVKVLPAAETEITALITENNEQDAFTKMIQAVGSPFAVTGAACFDNRTLPHPIPTAPETLLVCLRVEGISESTQARFAGLRSLFANSTVDQCDGTQSARLWQAIRNVEPFAAIPSPASRLWRLSLPPAQAAQCVAAIRRLTSVTILYDWGGSLVWMQESIDDQHDRDHFIAHLQHEVSAAGGFLRLIRGDETTHRQVLKIAAAANPAQDLLARRIKASFDPNNILNPGKILS